MNWQIMRFFQDGMTFRAISKRLNIPEKDVALAVGRSADSRYYWFMNGGDDVRKENSKK